MNKIRMHVYILILKYSIILMIVGTLGITIQYLLIIKINSLKYT